MLSDGPPESPSAATGGGLSRNVVDFARLLRDHGMRVPLRSVMTACSALERIDVGDVRRVFYLLRGLFVCRREHLQPFESLFETFWLQRATAATVAGSAAAEGPAGAAADEGGPPPGREAGLPEGAADERVELRTGYSALAAARRGGPPLPTEEEARALYDALQRLIERLRRQTSRRLRLDRRGRRVSLRRLLRRNMRFGGEPLLLDFQRRRRRRRRLVALCDVSGSMDVHTLLMLQFVHLLARATGGTEVFCFSTALTRVTELLRRQTFDQALRALPETVTDWGGGTRIGASLAAFNAGFGGRLLTGRTVVMLFSDGWDRGPSAPLAAQMAVLRRRAFRVVWLNPLRGTPGYAPLCRGMRTALPYVDHFLAAGRLHEFARVGQILERLMT